MELPLRLRSSSADGAGMQTGSRAGADLDMELALARFLHKGP